MATKISSVALAVSSALLLVACGGGGGGGSSTPATPASTNVTITPSLGKFSTGCAVEIRKGTGELLNSQTINANGTVTIAVTGYSGPIIAQVKGSDGCTYYDEASNSNQPFGAGQLLSAVVPEVRSELSVNVLTNLAAARVLDGDKLATGKTETEINRENATVQQMFQVGDMFAAPTLIGSPDDKFDNTEAGKLAAKLAALAELARNNGGMASFSKALANDLKDDGDLNTVALDTTALRAALQTAVDKYAQPADKTALDTLDDGTTLHTKVSDVQDAVDKVLAAGTALQQAKQIFADLRTSIMSISNEAGTGSLDVQSAALRADFQNGVDVQDTIQGLTLMIDAINQILVDQSDTFFWGKAGYCNLDNGGRIICDLNASNTNMRYSVALTATPGSPEFKWEIIEASNMYQWPPTPVSGLTGTISLGATTTITGKFYPMTAEAAWTDVKASIAQNNTPGQRTWNVNGTLNALKADGRTSTLKTEITEFSINESTQTAKLVATLTSPRHRFEGTLSFSDQVSSGKESEPKNGTLVGIFTDISNSAAPFKFLEGTLTVGQDWTGFDKSQAESASNYAKITASFDGTAYKSAGVTGLGLSLAINNKSGFEQETGNFSFKGSNGIIVSGTASNNVWTISNANGINADYNGATKSGKVRKADGTELGTISNQRVTFIDGTFESLI